MDYKGINAIGIAAHIFSFFLTHLLQIETWVNFEMTGLYWTLWSPKQEVLFFG